MKKIISLTIICLLLVTSFTGCDMNDTPEQSLPMSETVTLAELIKKDDISYIRHKETFDMDTSELTYITSHNVDELFAKVIYPNADLELIHDLEGDDLFDQKWHEAWDTINPKNGQRGDNYILWDIYDDDGIFSSRLRIFSNGTIIYFDFDGSPNLYVSVDYANLDFYQLIEDLYR